MSFKVANCDLKEIKLILYQIFRNMSKKQEDKMMVPDEIIMSKIYLIRGKKVMLDRDLAELYGVETKVLKQAVKRNIDIFPEHFMFELTKQEFENLRSQTVTSSWGGQRYLPYVFTDHGVLQVANVLRSKRAKKMSIRIIEVFIKMHEIILNQLSNKELFFKFNELEKKFAEHDDKIMLIFEYLKQLEQDKQEELEQQNRKRIGYKIKGKE